MRTFLGAAGGFLIGLIAMGGCAAYADSNNYQNNSQFGLNLPTATLPSGQDEIRTADGTSCRSSVGGDGAYMDMGVLGTPETSDVGASAAAYGRLVIPFGAKPSRIDCSQLYNLEIARLKMELELAKMGLGGKKPTEEADLSESWANDGWVNGRGDSPTTPQPETPPKKAEAPEALPPASSEPLEDPWATNSTTPVQPAKKKLAVVEPAADVAIVEIEEPAPMSLYGDEVVDSLY